MAGKQVRLFLAEGSTAGLLTAEIMNWTGHVVAVPRSAMSDYFDRAESQATGVYILVGDDPDGLHEMKIYVGEGDVVGGRIRSHMRDSESGGKDFWDRAYVITSKDANITKAHARYLESRLIKIAEEGRRVTIDNSTSPPLPALPEADASDMEYFVDQLRILLPVLGLNILKRASFHRSEPQASPVPSAPSPEPVQIDSADDASPVFTLRVAKNPDRYATAMEVDSEFVVSAGSFGSADLKVMVPGYEALRESLIKRGVLRLDTLTGLMVAEEDLPFDSPSAAASVMNAGSENGRRRWVTDDGLSYGLWQATRADAGSGIHATGSAADGDPAI